MQPQQQDSVTGPFHNRDDYVQMNSVKVNKESVVERSIKILVFR